MWNLRNIGALTACAALLSISPVAQATPTCGPSLGDVDHSGQITISDVQCAILGALASIVSADPPACVGGDPGDLDVSCDGSVGISDVQLVVNLALGISLNPALDADGDSCPDACQVPVIPPIAASADCLADDHCATGHHCRLGECVAACSVDAPCPGTAYCDAFGRCTGATQPAIRVVAAPEEGRLRVYPSILELPSVTDSEKLYLSTDIQPIQGLRVTASGGATLECLDAQGAVTSSGLECEYAGLGADGAPVAVRVGWSAIPYAADGAPIPAAVRVFAGSQHRTVAVVASPEPASAGSGSGGGLPAPAGPGSAEPGTFEGTARLISAGWGESTLDAPLSWPVSATRYGDATFLLHDPTGAVFGEAEVSAALHETVDGQPQLVVAPTTALTSGSGLSEVEVVVVGETTTGDPAGWAEHEGAVDATLALRAFGLDQSATGPTLVWQISLARTGDIDPAATGPMSHEEIVAAWQQGASAVAALDTHRDGLPQKAVDLWSDKVQSYPHLGSASWTQFNHRGQCAAPMVVDVEYKAHEACKAAVLALPATALGIPSFVIPDNWQSQYGTTAAGQAQFWADIRDEMTTLVCDKFVSGNTIPKVIGPQGFVGSAIVSIEFQGDGGKAEVESLSDGSQSGNLTLPLSTPGCAATGKIVDGPETGWTCFGICGYTAQFPEDFYHWSIPVTLNSKTYNKPCGFFNVCPQPVVGTMHLWLNEVQGCKVPIKSERSASDCAELALCSDSLGSLTGTPLGESIDGMTGDLLCSGDTVSADRAPLLNVLEMSAPDGMLEDCLSDITSDPLPAGASMSELFSQSSCFSSGRFLLALGHALDGPLHDQSPRLAMRLLQQRVEVGAHIARESARQNELQVTLGVTNYTAFLNTALSEIEAAGSGFDALLQPAVGELLRTMDADEIAQPDYRADFGVGAASTQTPVASGLPITIADAIAAQMDSLGYIITLTHLIGWGEFINAPTADVARQQLRRAQLALAVANGLVGRAISEGSVAPTWLAEWHDIALPGATAAMARAHDRLASFVAGDNPLGVEDSDLPLYYDGDALTTAQKFTAISDFVGNKAAVSVANAVAAHASAVGAWQTFAEDSVQQRWAESDLEQRLEDTQLHYGEQLQAMCAIPQLTAFTVLLDPSVDAETCFIEPACGVSPSDRAQRASTADIGYELCFLQQLRGQLGTVVTTGDPNLDAAADALGAMEPGQPFSFAISVDASGASPTIALVHNGATITALELTQASYGYGALVRTFIPPGASVNAVEAARSVCRSAALATEALRPGSAPSSCETSDECPVGLVCVADACAAKASEDVTSDPQCVRGSLGELALGAAAAQTGYELASTQLDEHIERYDLAMRKCIGIAGVNDEMQGELADHNDAMQDLRIAKLAVDIAANVAGAAKDCAAAANSSGIGAVFSGGGSTGAVCGAAATEAALESASDALQYGIDDAEAKHAEVMLSLESKKEELICRFEAKQELVGTRSASLAIAQAALELGQAQIAYKRGKATTRALLTEGRMALASMTERYVSPLVDDYWLLPGVADFHRTMRQARRMTYLAARAVEYEMQQSLSATNGIVSAMSPDDLVDWMLVLDSVIDTGKSGCGTAPKSSTVVLSLRDDILQLADHSTLDEGTNPLSLADRFHAALTSEAYAVYDDGIYDGQLVPFTVAPFGVGGTKNPGTAFLMTPNRCAERTWLVNAATVSDNLPLGQSVSLELRHRNTFYSQSCYNEGQVNVASTRPSRNLFADPTNPGFTTPTSDPGEADAYAFATIDAPVRSAFELKNLDPYNGVIEEYQDGFTPELAARALFGDYWLFIPAEQIHGVTAGGKPAHIGIALHAVDDILIRFDYVSAGLCP